MENVLTSFCDEYPRLRNHKAKFCILLGIICFALGLPCVTKVKILHDIYLTRYSIFWAEKTSFERTISLWFLTLSNNIETLTPSPIHYFKFSAKIVVRFTEEKNVPCFVCVCFYYCESKSRQLSAVIIFIIPISDRTWVVIFY